MSENQKLTRKEQIFVEEYLKDFNGTRAALAAGYSPKSARTFACSMLTKQYIVEKIDESFNKRKKSINAQRQEILAELRLLAFARMKTYVTVKNGRVNLVDTDCFEDGEDAAVQSYSETTTLNGGSSSIKLYDKIAALKLYAEMLGFFFDPSSDKKGEVALSGEGEKPIEVKMSPDDYLKYLMSMAKPEPSGK